MNLFMNLPCKPENSTPFFQGQKIPFVPLRTTSPFLYSIYSNLLAGQN
jgi:hypothetical protein